MGKMHFNYADTTLKL